jgi:[glutamine synthetase] adenylyltransferase / [glutamine synthetase]-adenylyl-L-tyrosine phosphorylase
MDENRTLCRLVASLFGTSVYLSRQFLDHPELFDALLAAGRASPRIDVDSLRRLARARIDAATGEAGGDDEPVWSALAEIKNAQVLRIGLADIAGELGPEEVCHELSAVAEVALERAYDLVAASLAERHGVAREETSGEPATLAVLALGKLGGRELGYASDLDVVFVYSADGESDGERPLPCVTYMTRFAQRLMSGLHTRHPGGRLYEVDTRLRPSGSKGLLVSSLSAWERYHRADAQLWERQALTRLRPIAGSAELGARAAAIAADCTYNRAGDDPAAIAGAMRAMRDKMERELTSPSTIDFKAGRGGLVDIEFASQYLQLVLGPKHPSLRTPSTLSALRAATLLVPRLAAELALLADAYLHVRRIEHRVRMVHDASEHQLPTEPAELDKLARRVGLTDGASLLAMYGRWSADVRRAYDAVLNATDLA